MLFCMHKTFIKTLKRVNNKDIVEKTLGGMKTRDCLNTARTLAVCDYYFRNDD